MTGVSRHGELGTSRAASRGWSSWTANHDAVRFEIGAGDAGSGTWSGAVARFAASPLGGRVRRASISCVAASTWLSTSHRSVERSGMHLLLSHCILRATD
jgi:hypothetical protein